MTVAVSAASRQCAVRVAMTLRNVRCCGPPGGGSVLYARRLRNRCTLSGVVNRSMTRRSAGVNSDRAGASPTPGVRLLENATQVREDGRRRPVGAGVDLDDAAVRANESGSQVMRD